MELCAILTSRHISTIRSPFSRQLITCNFSSVPIFFHQFSTWIALGDADLCFSLLLVRKANAVEEQTKWDTAYITNIITPYTWLMVWQWCHFLLASYRRYEWPWIAYANLHLSKTCLVNSKSGVIFLALEWNCEKWELPVFTCDKKTVTIMVGTEPRKSLKRG
jgi:hypothetical protein